MPRTVTHANDEFAMLGRGSLIFSSKSSYAGVNCATSILPVGSKVQTGLHWHETHTEYLQVVQGAALITLGDEKFRAEPKDGIIVVPRYTKHEYQRADTEPEDGKVDLIIKEFTDPADGNKERFFRNLTGVIGDREAAGGLLANIATVGQLFVLFHGHDNYPALLRLPSSMGPLGRAVERGFTISVLWSVATLGWFAGWRSEYPEYTPGL